MAGSLDGKVALVTGGGSGIGRQSALVLARAGARVTVADINAASGEETAGMIRQAGGTALALRTDVGDPESVSATIEETVRSFGGLHVLHNNAGGSAPTDGRVTDIGPSEFWRALKLDLYGTWLCCHYGIPQIIRSGGGAVINMTSMVALMGNPGKDAYTAAKGGIQSLTRSMAVEYAGDKVRVNAIAPSATRTERVVRMLENDPTGTALLKRHLVGLPEPEDIANAVLFLASDESRMITGHILPVDSGVTIS